MGRPNQTHERLDALLDGRPGEVTDDLAPLLEAAESLRAELAQFELDPKVAGRHLERVLNGSAPVVPLPVRRRGSGGLRRRVAAVALAAALVLVPATMASAASSDALPGQALYSVKLVVEQVRLASVQWSPTREAAERTRQASSRLQELDKLVRLRIFRQVPPAIRRLDAAVVAAREAVEEAAEKGGGSELAAVAVKLQAVGIAQHVELRTLQRMVAALPAAEAHKIAAAVKQSPALAEPIAPPALPPTSPPVTTAPPSGEPPAITTPPTGSTPVPDPPPPATPVTTAAPVTEPTAPPVSDEPEPSTTVAPPATPTTTAPPEDGSTGAGKSETGVPSTTTGP